MASANDLKVKARIDISVREQLGVWIAEKAKMLEYQRAESIYILERDEHLFHMSESPGPDEVQRYKRFREHLYKKHLRQFEVGNE